MALPASPARIVRFGIFELDLASAELRKHGLRVRIQEQPYQVLSALLERPGELVSRDELVRRLWPDGTFVDFDRGLNAAVTRLRQTLSDSAENPRYVETVARRGYRFLTAVETPAESNGHAQGRAAIDDWPAAEPTPAKYAAAPRGWWNGRRLALYGGSLGLMMLVAALLLPLRSPVSAPGRGYVQITDFTDSAIAPALSPDGRTVAFIRSNEWFLSRDQIWLKSLPDGEPVPLTHNSGRKFGLAFSPDGSQLAYSSVEPARTAWDTQAVPVLGGEPALLMGNAEGLTWIDRSHVLFSEIKDGIHMAVVTARSNRSEARDVYVPEHARGMAHFSYASPDGKWVLVIEMDHTAAWQPCRLVPFDGSSPGRQVGPRGACSSAGWSPDGKWMYFTGSTSAQGAQQVFAVPGGHNLWRQRFPRGEPEQVTFGPAEAQGVAMAPDGRSLITSLGMQQTAVWIHDSRGDRPLSSVGNASLPKFSPDGTRVYYLVNRGLNSENELWGADPGAGRTERLLSGFQITGYDIADNGTEIVFAALTPHGKSQIWLAPLDRRSSPVLIASGGEDSPYFGLNGQIVFRMSDGKANYLFRMNRDGSGRTLVVPHPILNVMSVSPDRRWIATLVAVNDAQAKFAEVAIPAQGGVARRICSGFCIARWAPDGRHFYVTLEPGRSGQTAAIPVPAGETLPELPALGIRTFAESLSYTGAFAIEHTDLAPGLNPASYAYVKGVMQRNLFRIPIP